MTNPHKFTLGQRVRDTVTGYTGIAINRLEYLNGCVQYCLKPPIDPEKPGAWPEGQYVDDEQLELVDEGILDPPSTDPIGLTEAVATGGPSYRESEPPR